MSQINSAGQDATPSLESESWPRDFDFREQYAEQQELLQSPSEDTLNHSKGENHA